MSLISGLLHQYIDTISSVTKDKYGDETSTAVYTDVPCRWTSERRLISTAETSIEAVEITAWLPPEYNIEYDYRVVKDGVTYKIASVEKYYDLDGVLDHLKVVLL